MKTDLTRRTLLRSMASLLAAPVIVRASSLMAIKPLAVHDPLNQEWTDPTGWIFGDWEAIVREGAEWLARAEMLRDAKRRREELDR